MRRRDIELISALAEGTLEDESEARALIESSAEHRAEYETLKAAIDATRHLPPATLTGLERSALRRDIWAELRSGEDASRSLRWYLTRPVTAAALLLVVGAIAVLSQMNIGPESAGSLEEGSPDLVTAAESARESVSSEDMSENDSEGLALAPSAEADPALYEELADAVRSDPAVTEDQTTDYVSAYGESPDDCLATAGLDNQVSLGTMETPWGQLVLVAAPDQTPGPETPISFVDPETCQLIFTAD